MSTTATRPVKEANIKTTTDNFAREDNESPGVTKSDLGGPSLACADGEPTSDYRIGQEICLCIYGASRVSRSGPNGPLSAHSSYPEKQLDHNDNMADLAPAHSSVGRSA